MANDVEFTTSKTEIGAKQGVSVLLEVLLGNVFAVVACADVFCHVRKEADRVGEGGVSVALLPDRYVRR